MPITPDHAGRTYPPTAPYPVTAGKIAEFAEALADPAPAYRAADEAIAPPTFAAVVVMRAWEQLFADPELELALHRIVHADQKFTWERPLRAGDAVTAAVRIDQVRLRGAAEFITASVDLRSDGEPLGTATATFLHSREAA